MVSWAKMLEKTGTPSCGQLLPVNGSQLGEEYFRSPTRVIGVGLGPVTTACEPYGMCREHPTGISPVAIVKALSAANGPHAKLASPVRSEIFCRSMHVWGLPKLRSFVA